MSALAIDRTLAARDHAVLELWQQQGAGGGNRPGEARKTAVPRTRRPRVPSERDLAAPPARHGRPAISFNPEQRAEILALRRAGCAIGEIAVRFGVDWRVIRRNLPADEPPSRRHRKMTAEQRAEIRALSAAGQSQIAIARRLMIAPSAVFWALRPERPARRPDDPERGTRRIAFTAEECASIAARHQQGQSCCSIAKSFALDTKVIARVLREAGVTITDETHRRTARNARILTAAQRGLTIPAIAAELSLSPMVVYKVVARAARTTPGLAYKPRGRNANPSEREQIRDLWMAGLPYAAIGERLGFKRSRVKTILIKMRQRGEIGARPTKLGPERPVRCTRNSDRFTRRIAFTAEECASIAARYQQGESCCSIAKSFAHSPDVIARVLREAGTDWRNRRIVFTAEEWASIAARYQQGESCCSIAKSFAHSPGVIARVLREAGTDWRNRRIVFTAEECASIVARYQHGESRRLIAKTFGHSPDVIARVLREAGTVRVYRSASASEREQVRDLWIAGLPYAAIGERLGFTKHRVTAILTKMRQCGEIGVRPVALRALQVRLPARLPTTAIPAVLLQMAQGMSYRDIARHWEMSRGEMYGFLTELRRRKGPVDPALPPPVTVIRLDQVPALLLQLARGVRKIEIARQWRVNPKALYGFFRRQLRRPIGAPT
jgi:DNA invertase Pin-like site-specific DNA recombinase/methylmalonyl-CoA mutase cobalamin-binding subunit